MQENSLKQEMIRKIRIYPFWCPCQKRPFIHLISCTDDCQITPISLKTVSISQSWKIWNMSFSPLDHRKFDFKKCPV